MFTAGRSVYRELVKWACGAPEARAPSVAWRKSNIDPMLILLLSYEGFVPNRIIYSPVNANSYTLLRPSGVRTASTRVLPGKSDSRRKPAGIPSWIHVRHGKVT